MRGDTICALLTAKGRGAISVIRISGPLALKVTRKSAPFLPLKPESHRVYLGVFKQSLEPIDEVLVTFFAQGRSFTGEESLEIACHGGEIYKDILKALLKNGARLAERGEFSLQAFSNGKMDLAQAEGILQLIESKSPVARRHSFFQLKGLLSQKLKNLEKKWLFLLSQLEADIDFSLEDLAVLSSSNLKNLLEELKQELKKLLSRYQPFEKLQKGLVCGIFGQSNVGKSSLFNALLEEDKAIVSKEEGTTRDLVEGSLLQSEGLNISLKDSAGFRESPSLAEQKGQEKSKELFFLADYKLILMDSRDFKNLPPSFLFQKPQQSLLVCTKTDLLTKKCEVSNLVESLRQKNLPLAPKDQIFFVSSVTKEGLKPLREKILSFGKIHSEDFLISNARHYKLLKTMEESLKQSLLILSSQGERDLMALELRQGLLALYEILGQQIEDGVLDTIFKQFCIGK